MLIFQGAAQALTAQERWRLSQVLGDTAKLDELQSRELIFMSAKEADLTQRSALYQLLCVEKPFDTQVLQQPGCFVVIPRLGTISPWSSKATEIVQQAGWPQIQRVEHGRWFQCSPALWASLDERTGFALQQCLFDSMTESQVLDNAQLLTLFDKHKPQPLTWIPLQAEGREALLASNQSLGLALSDAEIDYLYDCYQHLERDPTDVELMMFAQVNSEHCRHKIFNAKNFQGEEALPHSLFSMIRHTYKVSPDQALVAYSDNAAVLQGALAERFYADPKSGAYQTQREAAHFVLKVETHNHPTAISPFAGAATGSGGEIRDEAATGRGAMAKAGMCGFSVSHLHIPDYAMPWEFCLSRPQQMASALEIMLEAPIGAASFNNEFGRPNLCGYFRTFATACHTDYGEVYWGYHKPIMIAGGVGQIRDSQVYKRPLTPGCLLIVLGGPGMPIGLGGGAASSKSQGENAQDLDFASVQRSNPEMQRRCQEVINTCWALGEENPVISIHDVGAGGLSNALPELVEADDLGARIELRKLPNDAPGMSPLELWCNEAQERYVLAIDPQHLSAFEAIASRENCPFAVVGQASVSQDLEVVDAHFDNDPVNLPMDYLFEKMPPLARHLRLREQKHQAFSSQKIEVAEAVTRVLQFPAVASKQFLITIGDRSVTGLVARDQMVGPWQVPVADVAVTANSYTGFKGEAMAVGERAPIALLHAPASARMAVGEAITNIAAASISDLTELALSANWMAAADYPGEGLALYEAVRAVGMELCPALGISIPVGKDSLSMRTKWQHEGQVRSVTSPVSLVITAAAPVNDVRKTLTPMLRTDQGDSVLLLLDLGQGANCLGGSVLAQVYGELGQRPADIDDPKLLANFFHAVQRLNQADLLLAYHDRSDGGLLTTLVEMMFAAHCGLTLDVTPLGNDATAALFSEELGAVVQVRRENLSQVLQIIRDFQLGHCCHELGRVNAQDSLVITHQGQTLYQASRVALAQLWSTPSYRLQALRDNPACAKAEFESLARADHAGICVDVRFDLDENPAAPYLNLGAKPRCAILREQGVNGHIEMAQAFTRAGFETVDVHMNDLLSGQKDLSHYHGLAACGGFSYGDVLGAGRGWAGRILQTGRLHDQFSRFFHRDDTFTLGVCNGCQMLSQLKTLIPGAEHWPNFVKNTSEQFEARLVSVEVVDSPSIFLQGMTHSRLPVVVAHGEGHVQTDLRQQMKWQDKKLIALRYVDDQGVATERYPDNPNGSMGGVTGLTSLDGRATIMMPHPERVVRTAMHSWAPDNWPEYGPWIRLFRNARQWLG